MTDAVMYSSEKPPFTLTVTYRKTSHTFLVEVRHTDGRHQQRIIDALWEPLFGIDVGDQFEIDGAAETMCVEMERDAN
jgi:hypothetical protein